MQQISASALAAICPHRMTPSAVAVIRDRVITAELDSLVGSQAGVVRLQGNVVINDGQRVLLAEEALLNQGDRRVGFPQGLVLGQNDFVVQGQQAAWAWTVKVWTCGCAMADAQTKSRGTASALSAPLRVQSW